MSQIKNMSMKILLQVGKVLGILGCMFYNDAPFWFISMFFLLINKLVIYEEKGFQVLKIIDR